MIHNEPSNEFIEYICRLYGDKYDDRVEDSRPPVAGLERRDPGKDWMPGQLADHKSLASFQRELKELGISLSSSKIRKILITGERWSTERSRQVTAMFEQFTKPMLEGGYGLTEELAIKKISTDLGISTAAVSVNLPYHKVIYNLENRSRNAIRCARYKKRKKARNAQHCKVIPAVQAAK